MIESYVSSATPSTLGDLNGSIDLCARLLIMATSNTLAPLPDDKNMGRVLVIIISILVVFTIVTTVLRLWVRGKRKVLGWVSIYPELFRHQ